MAKRSEAPIPGERLPSWRHQKEAFHHCMNRPAAMLDMKMGTGKTKVVIDVASTLAKEKTVRVLVLCPKAVVPVWPDQIKQHAHEGVNFQVLTRRHGETVAKFSDRLQRSLYDRSQLSESLFVVINYDSARLKPLGQGENPYKGGVLHQLRWDLVVLDESHRAKKPSGPTHLMIKRMRDRAGKRICLSGTPYPQGPVDGWSQFMFLDPRVLGTSFVAHRRQYCRLGGPNKNWIVGQKNTEGFAQRVAPLTYSCGDDVVDLPDLTISSRYFDLSAEERKAYNAMEADFVAWVNGDSFRAENALTKLLRLSQLTSGFATVEDDRPYIIGRSRVDALSELLKDIGREERVVVFTRFQHDTQAVSDVLRERDPLGIVDEVSGRVNTVGSKWKGGSTGLVAQIQSGSLGVDFTAGRYGILYGDTFDHAAYEQLKKRIHRPGQTRPCSLIHLVARDTVNEAALSALARKKKTSETIETIVRNHKEGDLRC